MRQIWFGAIGAYFAKKFWSNGSKNTRSEENAADGIQDEHNDAIMANDDDDREPMIVIWSRGQHC